MLEYILKWDSEAQSFVDGAEATWGTLRVSIDDLPIWQSKQEPSHGVHWTWIDLLEQLAGVWPWLAHEQSWPSAALPTYMDPSLLQSKYRRVLDSLAAPRRAAFEDEVYQFRDRHDLSMGVQGKRLPSFWVVREGRRAWVGTDRHSRYGHWDEVRQVLESLGEEIAERLRNVSDPRSKDIVLDWEDRSVVEEAQLAAMATGISLERLRRVVGEDVAGALELDIRTPEPTELSFAARLANRCVSEATLKEVFRLIRATPFATCASELDRLAANAKVSALERPQDQGVALAQWLRRQLSNPENRVEPVDLLASWAVSICEMTVDDEGLDALACWGPRHGPSIYLNTKGRHAGTQVGKRATLAHEICHLLLDRTGGLPLADINGRAHTGRIEQRARAFAGEFLVPAVVAGRELANVTSADEAERRTRRLAKRLGASLEVVAWKVQHSGVSLPEEVMGQLAKHVPQQHAWQFFA